MYNRKHTLHFQPDATYADQTLQRFWSYVDKDIACACHSWEERCWPWKASRTPNGYGKFHWNRKEISAHRFAYQTVHGLIPHGIYVLHTPPCILRHCVRHIYGDTQKQNAADASAMGRLYTGESHAKVHNYYVNRPSGLDHPLSRFSESDILSIRKYKAEGMSQTAIAKLYSCSASTIGNIVHYRCYKNIQ